VSDIESEIARREERIDQLHALFGSDEILRDGTRIKQLRAELDEHQLALAELYEHWEEASELN
jgi:hypothetical protein